MYRFAPALAGNAEPRTFRNRGIGAAAAVAGIVR
jgi:hypothetical protein